mmetsp:Transcript_5715/g.10367  ORF Transcript_5715/g.10367 Transcript_5715/m.10367 type:complete len:264 (+) Transcript_5715:480-1271(+)
MMAWASQLPNVSALAKSCAPCTVTKIPVCDFRSSKSLLAPSNFSSFAVSAAVWSALTLVKLKEASPCTKSSLVLSSELLIFLALPLQLCSNFTHTLSLPLTNFFCFTVMPSLTSSSQSCSLFLPLSGKFLSMAPVIFTLPKKSPIRPPMSLSNTSHITTSSSSGMIIAPSASSAMWKEKIFPSSQSGSRVFLMTGVCPSPLPSWETLTNGSLLPKVSALAKPLAAKMNTSTSVCKPSVLSTPWITPPSMGCSSKRLGSPSIMT